MSMEKKNPIPQGKYVPATRFENLIFTAGMTPRKDGVLQMSCKVKAEEALETYKDAVRLAATNALTAARNKLIETLTAEMRETSARLEFEQAAFLRDKIKKLKEQG